MKERDERKVKSFRRVLKGERRRCVDPRQIPGSTPEEFPAAKKQGQIPQVGNHQIGGKLALANYWTLGSKFGKIRMVIRNMTPKIGKFNKWQS